MNECMNVYMYVCIYEHVQAILGDICVKAYQYLYGRTLMTQPTIEMHVCKL